VKVFKPDVVVYCSAIIDERICERDPQQTLFVNIEAPALFAQSMAKFGGKFIYLSSSKVFSGTKGNYSEADHPQPQGLYGQSKLRAEEELSIYESSYSLRLSTIFGLGREGQRSSMLNRILRSLWSKEETRFINDEYRTFVGATEVARAVASIIDSRSNGGVFHLSNGERDTYYSFAKAVGNAFGLPTDHFIPIKGAEFHGENAMAGGKRGADLTLSGDRFSEVFGMRVEGPFATLEKICRQLREGNF